MRSLTELRSREKGDLDPVVWALEPRRAISFYYVDDENITYAQSHGKGIHAGINAPVGSVPV